MRWHLSPFEVENYYLNLLKEFNKIDFQQNSIELNEDLTFIFHEAHNIIHSWRELYGVPINDPSLAEIDIETISKDLLIHRLRQLGRSPIFHSQQAKQADDYYDLTQLKSIKNEDDLMNEFEITCLNIKHNRGNYADDSEIEEYMKEKLTLQLQSKFNRTNATEEELRDLIVRTHALRSDSKLSELQEHYRVMNQKYIEQQINFIRSGQQK